MAITRPHLSFKAVTRSLAAPLLLAAGLAACDSKPSGDAPATSTSAGASAKPAGATSAAAVAKPAPAPGEPVIKEKTPAVANLAEAKKYAGTKITYYGDSVGMGAELDKALAKQFSVETGIEVNLVPRPKDSTDSYSTYQRFFQAQSTDVDVMTLDVIWPGAFGQNLADLGPKLGEAAKQHVESIVKNNTVDGKLVAMPVFTDFGMLYYRTDLLKKYGYEKPPETWDQLDEMAKKIQDGEKPGNPNFAGYVWQGKAYEGLSCNALEWVSSHGGGGLVEGGKITVNNPQAAKALARAHKWIGGISPAGVTGYEEEDARNAFQGGNAAFMRNWPYAYAAGNEDKSLIKGKFDVAPLPHDPGQKSAATIGGWQVGVSKNSKNQDASIEFVRYLASPEAQKFRAVVGSFIPTIPAIQQDPDVVKAMPFLAGVKDAGLVARPSNAAGARYNEVSIAFFQAVSQALQGKDPKEVLGQAEQRMQRAMR